MARPVRIDESAYRGTDPDRSADQSLAWRARQPIVPAVKKAARLWGSVTASTRCLPDYLIIGAKRSGSTTLARNLVAADDVCGLYPQREDRKGTYFFDVHYANGPSWYRSHFITERARHRRSAALGRSVVVGEASPYYLHHPHAPARAADLVPDAKIICVVRDPVDRAFSHFRERVRQGIEAMSSFDDAVAAEPRRLAGEWQRMLDDPNYTSLSHLNYGYLAQSEYATALRRWYDHYDRRQVFVVSSTDLFADPEATIDKVRAFLGLGDEAPRDAVHFNQLPPAEIPATTRSQLNAHFDADQAALATLAKN